MVLGILSLKIIVRWTECSVLLVKIALKKFVKPMLYLPSINAAINTTKSNVNVKVSATLNLSFI